MMNWLPSVGAVLALIALVLTVVFMATGQLPLTPGGVLFLVLSLAVMFIGVPK